MGLTGNILRTFGSRALLLAIMFIAASAYAQDRIQSILTDPRMVVIPVRTLDEVDADIDDAEGARQRALNRQRRAESRLQEIENAIEARQQEIKDAGRRQSEAKKAKRESEVVALQVESKAGQQAIDLLKRLRELRKAEIDEAKADADLAEIEIRVLRLESELQSKRAENNSLSTAGGGNLTQTTAQQVLRELEVRLLKLQREQAAATQKLASKQMDIVGRRTKLHQAQLKLGMPR